MTRLHSLLIQATPALIDIFTVAAGLVVVMVAGVLR